MNSNIFVRQSFRASFSTLMFSLFLVAASLAPFQESRAESEAQPFVVLELFTSQGCSSCPPADRVLREVSERAAKSGEKVIPLSFHVDYWNYLGWKDPYSGGSATSRQREYVRALGARGSYTPQLVINGTTEFPGGQRSKVYQSIEEQLRDSPSMQLSLGNLKRSEEGSLSVRYELSRKLRGELIRFALVSSPKANVVSKGENAGSTLSHTNVVHSFASLAAKNTRGEFSLPFQKKGNLDGGALVAFVQDVKSMRILAATSVPLKERS